ncbi:MAG: DUF1552 domain-containing protein [Gammaproteobacteria bacterium]|nr:DUF1552 domain-containing protein [Gammaproteobacteria bacterium]
MGSKPMYLTKKHLSRRTVLRAAGVSLGLPLLDAMIPAGTALAQTAAAPKLRAGFFYIPHGAIMWNTPYGAEMDRWTPSGAGPNFKLSPILEPLEPYKHLVTSFGHLENKAPNNSVHTLVPATWLSAVKPDQDATGAKMAATIDQMIADKIGQETVLPSLELAAETTIQSAACGGGGCYYSATLSFRDATTPLPMEFNPRKVFVQLFGAGDTPEERDLIAGRTRSILDLINERSRELQRTLGPEDRAVLESYLDSVRETERRVERASQRDLSGIDLPDAPIGELGEFDEQVRLMFDLIALAYQADVTRVATFFMVGEGTNRTYNHIGVPDAFHPLSHHANNLQRIEKLVLIQRYHVERFADFIDKLAQIPDGENSLLENSMFVYGSNMSNSDRHNNYPLPTLLVGGGAGTIKGGQHIDLPERTTLANFHLTVVNKAGLELQSISDSTGEIAGV